jgi:outer membrane protein assembly factor BamB
LWTATVGGFAFAPVIAGGRVFIGSSTGDLFAFDAAGETNCGGNPRTCTPLWRAATGAEYSSIGNLPAPAVTGSTLYYPSANGLDAFDPNGANGCIGVPNVCAPLWSADFGTGQPLGWPVVGNGVVYQSVFTSTGNVVALDAAGQRNCSGTPTMCTPLWTDNARSTATVTPALGPDGLLYAGFSALDVFSTDGTTGCSGTPVVCQPLHTASLSGGLTLAPSLANDIVVLGVFTGGNAALRGFEQGSVTPLDSFDLGSTFPGLVAIAGGLVYVATNDGHLQAWAP